jgi:hypothetical protein
MKRRTRFLAAGMALVAVLFAQLSLAAYACPFTAAPMQISSTIHTGCGGMPMDPDQPALCHAHGQQGDQSLDKPLVSLPVVVTLTGFAVVHGPDPSDVLGPPGEQPSLLTRATAPPLALRHCCLRI